MTKPERIRKLHELGWLQGWSPDADVPDVALEAAKAGYAAFHGIANDWPTIEQHWTLPRCALPDNMPQVEALARWGHKKITWTVDGDLPGITRIAFMEAGILAMRYWAEVSGIQPQYVEDRNSANIVMTTGVIDQSGGTLAWSELPNGNRQLTQKYDTREQWIISENPTNGIDLVRVICHELGHALGMGHIQSGNLLAPVYSRTIRKPQSGDIAEMRERYGPPATSPGPTPQPTPNPGGGTMGDIFGKLFGEIFKAIGPKLIELFMPMIVKAIEEWLRGIGPKNLADELTKVRLSIEAQPGAVKAAP